MSRKRSTRKRPDRQVHMLKEQLKIEEGIFDNRSMMSLWRMFNHNIISKLDFIIATGKEADVYIADSGTGVEARYVALKIFRIETSSFDRRTEYMLGDPRFDKIKLGIFDIVNEWCKKEYGNLKIAQLAGVHAPKPYYFKGNVLAMEFLGEDKNPSKMMKNTVLSNPEEVLNSILEDIKRLYGADLVHGDISEYNILMVGEIPYIIDFGQAVVTKHPKASEFLDRDITNLLYYFKKSYKVEKEVNSVIKYIKQV